MRYQFVQVSKERKWRSLQACLCLRSAAGWSHIQQQSKSMPACWPSDRLQSVADLWHQLFCKRQHCPAWCGLLRPQFYQHGILLKRCQQNESCSASYTSYVRDWYQKLKSQRERRYDKDVYGIVVIFYGLIDQKNVISWHCLTEIFGKLKRLGEEHRTALQRPCKWQVSCATNICWTAIWCPHSPFMRNFATDLTLLYWHKLTWNSWWNSEKAYLLYSDKLM